MKKIYALILDKPLLRHEMIYCGGGLSFNDLAKNSGKS